MYHMYHKCSDCHESSELRLSRLTKVFNRLPGQTIVTFEAEARGSLEAKRIWAVAPDDIRL